MNHYRTKPYRKNPRIARLQYRVKWFFWRTIATGSTKKIEEHAADLEQRHKEGRIKNPPINPSPQPKSSTDHRSPGTNP